MIGTLRRVIEVPRVSRRQGGAFTASQARGEGWSPSQVKRRVASGTWLRLPGGALLAADVTRDAQALAHGVQLVWPEAVAAVSTAASLWRLPFAQDDVVHVLAGRGRRTRGVVVHRPHADDGVWTTATGLRVTDWPTTVVQCLALGSLDDALDLYAWLSTRRRLDRSAVLAAASSWSPRKGTTRLRELLAITRSGAVSAAEHRFHVLLRAAGIDGWEANVQVFDALGHPAVVDVLFRARRVAIEIDGWRVRREREKFLADARRHNRVEIAGYATLRFTWWDVVERPENTVAEVRAMLAAAPRQP